MIDAAINTAGRQALISHFARLNETIFAGYARDLDQPRLALAIEIVLDGVPIALVRADEFDERAGLRGGDACCGFTFRARARNLLAHRILEARVANTLHPVGHPIDLGLEPYEEGPRRSFGSVEWLGRLRLAGHLARPADTALRPTVRVVCEGVLLIVQRLQPWSHRGADDDAKDVIHFDLHLPLAYADGDPHVVDVTDGAGRTLEGSPVWFQAFGDELQHSIERSGAHPARGDTRA